MLHFFFCLSGFFPRAFPLPKKPSFLLVLFFLPTLVQVHDVLHQVLPLKQAQLVTALTECPHPKQRELWSGHGFRLDFGGRRPDVVLCASGAQEAEAWVAALEASRRQASSEQ